MVDIPHRATARSARQRIRRAIRGGMIIALIGMGIALSGQRTVDAQGFFIAQPQPVEHRGTIEGFNATTRILTIATETEPVYALMNPTRRTTDGQLVGGVSPVQVRVTVYEAPRALRQGMFIQFRALVSVRDDIVAPVSDLRILAGLPGNGFSIDNGTVGDFLPENERGVGGRVDGGQALEDEMELIEQMRDGLPPEIQDRLPGGIPDVGGPDNDGPDIDGAADDAVADEVNDAGVMEDDADGGDEDGADDLAQDDDPQDDDRAAEDDADEENLLTQRMLVSGQISSISRTGRVTVLVPTGGRQQRVRFELAPDAIVLFESDDIRQASVGDQVIATGQSVEPPRFFAERIDVLHVSEDLSEEALARMDVGALLDGNAVADNDDAADGENAGDGNRPVDPFEVVRQEREAREAEEAEQNVKPPRSFDGKIYHGRIIRIN